MEHTDLQQLGRSELRQLGMVAASLVGALMLTGCDAISDLGGSDDDDGSGYIQLYNGSANAPTVYLTVNEDEDDEYTFSGAAFADASSVVSFDSDSYVIELAWKDADGDLESFYDDALTVSDDHLTLLALVDDVTTPVVYEYYIYDEDLDDDGGMFSIRTLNLAQSDPQPLDIYLSLSNETFNEAEILGQYAFAELSEEFEYDTDDYIIYVTYAGSDEVVYQSEEIGFDFTSQYTFVVRDNIGPGSSPFTLDRLLRSSTVTEYPNINSDASFRIYNAINQHDLMPEYQGSIDVYLDGQDDSPEVTALAEGSFSASFAVGSGDYSLDFVDPSSQTVISQNHLMTLNSNEDKTVFVFLKEETEEDDDGEEETTVAINTMVVDNSRLESLYSHHIEVVNLVDDYGSVKFYFVLSDETIDTASSSVSNSYANSSSIYLYNNTYQVYAIATEDSTDFIIDAISLTLDEQSDDLFLIMEEDESASSGYRITIAPQQGQ